MVEDKLLRSNTWLQAPFSHAKCENFSPAKHAESNIIGSFSGQISLRFRPTFSSLVLGEDRSLFDFGWPNVKCVKTAKSGRKIVLSHHSTGENEELKLARLQYCQTTIGIA